MSSAAATACTCTPRCRLRRTAASLNSALYSWTFFGPARGTRHLPLLGGSVYKSEAGSAASFKRLLGARRWMLVAMAPMVSILKDAGRVPQNLVATLQPAGRWLPSPRQPRVKQLTIRRPMIPDGDRRHSPESGCVVNEVPSLVRNENVI